MMHHPKDEKILLNSTFVEYIYIKNVKLSFWKLIKYLMMNYKTGQGIVVYNNIINFTNFFLSLFNFKKTTQPFPLKKY